MVLCNSCMNYRKSYDELCKSWDDESIVDAPKIEKHYCCMYDDSIPQNISNDKAECPYFMEKEPNTDGMQT